MPFDEKVAARVRLALEKYVPFLEKKMFGGLSFMVQDSMCVGVIGDVLVVRVGKDEWERALSFPHTRPMDFTGRPLTGFVYVDPPGFKTAATLDKWLQRAIAFVQSQPSKKKRPKKKLIPKRIVTKKRG